MNDPTGSNFLSAVTGFKGQQSYQHAPDSNQTFAYNTIHSQDMNNFVIAAAAVNATSTSSNYRYPQYLNHQDFSKRSSGPVNSHYALTSHLQYSGWL